MAFLTTAHSLFWESRRHGIRCVAICAYSSVRAAANGGLWPDHFPRCLERMVLRGEQELQGRMSRVYARKNEMAARLREFLKWARCLDTTHTCRPAQIIHIIKSLTQTFGATIRARRITTGM